MISLEAYIPFVLASSVILVIPGPTIILVISQSIAHGRSSVVPLTAGVLMGDFTAMICSLLGLGAVLSTSAALFTAFKWVGAFYLLYLGLKLWRTNPQKQVPSENERKKTSQSLLKSSFVVTALNPKSIAFFVAFLPQFIDPFNPAIPQLLVLGTTFLVLATLNAALYAIFAGQLSEYIKRERVQKWFNRCGGGALIGAGIITAGLQRSS